MSETVIDSGLRIYPSNNGPGNTALARDEEIFTRRMYHGANHVQTGADISVNIGVNRNVTISATRIFIDGRQVVDTSDGSFAFTAPANSTIYVMAKRDGSLVYRDTNNPATDSDLLLYTIVVGATSVTSYTDNRRFAAFTDIGLGDNEYLYLSTDQSVKMRYATANSRVELTGAFYVSGAATLASTLTVTGNVGMGKTPDSTRTSRLDVGGTVTSSSGVSASFIQTRGGQLTAAANLDTLLAFYSSTAAFAPGAFSNVDAYGMFIDAASYTKVSGTIRNAYGLFVSAPTIGTTSNYALYVNGLSQVQGTFKAGTVTNALVALDSSSGKGFISTPSELWINIDSLHNGNQQFVITSGLTPGSTTDTGGTVHFNITNSNGVHASFGGVTDSGAVSKALLQLISTRTDTGSGISFGTTGAGDAYIYRSAVGVLTVTATQILSGALVVQGSYTGSGGTGNPSFANSITSNPLGSGAQTSLGTYFNNVTRTFATTAQTGNVYGHWFDRFGIANPSAGTVPIAANIFIGGPVSPSTNLTITSAMALLIDAGASMAGVTNAYGIYVTAPTGATNNFAIFADGNAVFTGNNVRFGGSTIATNYGIYATPTITATTSGSALGLAINVAPTITAAAGGSNLMVYAASSGEFKAANFAGQSVYGYHVDLSTFTFTTGGGAGSFTNSYAGYFKAGTGATNNYAIYALNGPSRLGTRISVNVDPVAQHGFYFSPSATATGGLVTGIYAVPTLVAAANGDVMACVYVTPTTLTGASFTSLDARGIWVDGANFSATGTIANAYGLYVSAPAIGTTKYVAYFTGGRVDIAGTGNNLVINGATLRATTGAIVIKNGVEAAGQPTGGIEIMSLDPGGGASLCIRTEQSVVSESVTSDRTLKVTINGTSYRICLKV